MKISGWKMLPLTSQRKARATDPVKVSSIVAVGPAREGEVVDEDNVYHGDALRCDYMSTKHEAEKLALAAIMIAITKGVKSTPRRCAVACAMGKTSTAAALFVISSVKIMAMP